MNKFAENTIALALCAGLLGGLCSCGTASAAQSSHKQLFAMDTIMTFTAYGADAEAGLAAATATVTDLAAMLDPETEGSAVYELDNARGAAVEMPAQVIDMLSAARDVYDKTNGALDLSTYPLSKLWGFINLDTTGQGYVPTQAEIDACLAKLCFDKMTVNGQSVTIPDGSELGFGAVAKGYASDAVMAAMKAAGVDSAVVSLGGNVQTLGAKPGGGSWNVAVEDPSDTSKNVGVLAVGETAVITSGSYQRFFTQDGKTYHHILDPRTGYPADSGLLSVTIVCTSGVKADCLSTAMFVLGKDAALRYWRDNGGFEMLMIAADGGIFCTSGLQGVFTPESGYSVSYVQ